MHIAMLAPIAWRTPPRHYGPWESVLSVLTEGLVAQGVKVTLFATADSRTRARLVAVCPRGYEEDKSINPKVWESLHISEVFEQGDRFDLIHNHFDFLPLTYSAMTSTPLLTTIHGFSSPSILPVYRKYNGRCYYVSISNADRSPDLTYVATVYHGIDLSQFAFQEHPEDYLLFFGRIHHDKGTREAIEIARRAGKKLVIAGIVQDEVYFREQVAPFLDGESVRYVGSVGPERRNQLLGKAQALLHPINFNEPFGLSVVESMACGTPVIAFNRGSMPEVVASGRSGFLVSSVDEAVDRVASIKKIDRAACRQWVEERFSAERMVSDYMDVYARILSKGRSRDVSRGHIFQILDRQRNYMVAKILLPPGQDFQPQKTAGSLLRYQAVAGRTTIRVDHDEKVLVPGQGLDLPSGQPHVIFNHGAEPAVLVVLAAGIHDDRSASETMRGENP